jgi:hypothetical protein
MAEKDLNDLFLDTLKAKGHLLRREADLQVAAQNGEGGTVRPVTRCVRKA